MNILKNRRMNKLFFAFVSLIALSLSVLWGGRLYHKYQFDKLRSCTDDDSLWSPAVRAVRADSVVLQTSDLMEMTPGEAYEIKRVRTSFELIEVQPSGAYFIYTRTTRVPGYIRGKNMPDADESFQCKYYASLDSMKNSALQIDLNAFFLGMNKNWKVTHAVLLEGIVEDYSLSSIEQHYVLVDGVYKETMPFQALIELTKYATNDEVLEAYKFISERSEYLGYTSQLSLVTQNHSNYCFGYLPGLQGCASAGYFNNAVINVGLYFMDRKYELDTIDWENLVLTIEKNATLFQIYISEPK